MYVLLRQLPLREFMGAVVPSRPEDSILPWSSSAHDPHILSVLDGPGLWNKGDIIEMVLLWLSTLIFYAL